MTTRRIRRRFKRLHEFIYKVLISCETDDQLTAAYRWGINVISNHLNLIKHTETRKTIQYADWYSRHVLNAIAGYFLGKGLDKAKFQPGDLPSAN